MSNTSVCVKTADEKISLSVHGTNNILLTTLTIEEAVSLATDLLNAVQDIQNEIEDREVETLSPETDTLHF